MVYAVRSVQEKERTTQKQTEKEIEADGKEITPKETHPLLTRQNITPFLKKFPMENRGLNYATRSRVLPQFQNKRKVYIEAS